MNALDSLEVLGSLDTLPGRGDLDEDALLGNTSILVETNDLLGLGNGGLLIERKTGINLSGNTARDDLENLNTEVDKELVKSRLGLGLEGSIMVKQIECVLIMLMKIARTGERKKEKRKKINYASAWISLAPLL